MNNWPHFAFKTALNQHKKLMGEPFPITAILDIKEHDGFWALAEIHRDVFHIRISTGLLTTLSLLFRRGFQEKVFSDRISFPNDAGQKTQTQISLVWLMLHEMQHYNLGHFAFTGRHYLTETNQAKEFALVSCTPSKPKYFKNIEAKNKLEIEPCLELQADHDATELTLSSYSRDNWADLRTKIASIVAIMVLIEKHDAENNIEHSTHPKAATRIFQLLGHVTEMWSLPAHAKAKARGETTICEDDLPSEEEKQAFSKEVILPAFWDAVALAEFADAKRIIDELGSPEDFFADIADAKLGHWDELNTVGATEWAELKDANDLILPLLPINQTTT